MTRIQRVRYEMFLRVCGFGRGRPDLFPESSAGGQAFATLEEAVARIDDDAVTKPIMEREGREGIDVARAIVVARMRLIARTARGIRAKRTTADDPLRMPSRLSNATLLATARRFLCEVETERDGRLVRDELARLQLPAACIPELRQAVDDFDCALSERRAGRKGAAEAQAGISAAFARASAALRTLDIVVPNVVEQDAVEFAGWKRSREVIGARRRRRPSRPVKRDRLEQEEHPGT